MFAVVAFVGGASMVCAAFDTEAEARADRDARAARYPAWTFYVTPAARVQ